MWPVCVVLLVLGSFKTTNCDVELRIVRVADDNYTPVTFGVDEHIGQNLTLTCDLTSTDEKSGYIDDHIIWGKATPEFRFKNKTDLESLAKKKSKKLYSLLGPSDLNRARKTFTPLRAEDEGTYFCGSLKYMLFEVVYIVTRDVTATDQQIRTKFLVNLDENPYCNEKMFKCKSNGLCINPHYVCDKKPDCKDGSDESYETCNGDPCKDKLQCDDGRCIPMYWCCDRYHDLDCNVTYRPTCCQLLSDTYEELEYGYVPYNMTQVRPNNSTRYIFISLCILATVFSIVLMLLILSKVFLLAKKTTRSRDLFRLEETGAPYRSNVPYSYRNRNILSNVRYASAGCGGVLRAQAVLPADASSGASDALLILSDEIIRYGDGGSDRPPSYTDVMGQLEPPPPYTSQDCLNGRT